MKRLTSKRLSGEIISTRPDGWAIELPPTNVTQPILFELSLEISNDNSNRIGWVTFVGGSSMAHPSGRVEIISPDNLLEVNLFIEKCVQESESKVIVGDFLDNVIRSINSPESFYSFFCQLASRVKLKKRTAILVIKEDIHDRSVVETVKRFADLVLEFRDQDSNGALKVEMRTLNFADNIYTAWRPFSDWLQPISMTS